jgi:hypothetical protein
MTFVRLAFATMSPELLSAIAFVIGMIVAMNSSRSVTAKQSFEQQQILRAGLPAEGTVTQVWQPPLAGSFPRIYFRFEPRDGGAPVECCHIDRRPQGTSTASLPAVGSSVSVRYLPDNPRSAVIARLVSRFLQ